MPGQQLAALVASLLVMPDDVSYAPTAVYDAALADWALDRPHAARAREEN